MQKRNLWRLAFGLPFLFGCSLSLLGSPAAVPTATPASPTQTSAMSTILIPSPTELEASVTKVPATGTVPPLSDLPSGPYAVIQVLPGDTLTIRSAPGAGNPSVGSFSPSATDIMRTGPMLEVDDDPWVEVVNPSGSTGWVNAGFLTEYVPSATFCADGGVDSLIASLDRALTSENGELLASLTSPSHGATLLLWRYGNQVNFDREHIHWAFESTYAHDWGAAPGSGLETIGSFQETVLPGLQGLFNAGYSLTCNDLGGAPQYGMDPWPFEYTNINYYTIFKPGTPGIDLDWIYWLVGIEYVQDQPFLFAMIHFAWEP